MAASDERPTSGSLARLGFQQPGRALEQLLGLGAAGEVLLAILGRAADPDLALDGLVRLAEALDDASGGEQGGAGMLRELADDEGTAMRLLLVLGASTALADHLVRHPDQWRELTDPTLGCSRPPAYAVRSGLLRAVGAHPDDPQPVATLPDARAVDALRV